MRDKAALVKCLHALQQQITALQAITPRSPFDEAIIDTVLEIQLALHLLGDIKP